jgi:hypothetical protein
LSKAACHAISQAILFRNNSFVTYNLTAKSISFVLAPAAPTLLIAKNPVRRLLSLSVNGINPATFKLQSAPASATDGLTLGAASISGEQGGSLLLSDGNSPTTGGDTPVDAVYAYSTLGTTVSVIEGTVYAFL